MAKLTAEAAIVETSTKRKKIWETWQEADIYFLTQHKTLSALQQ